MVSLPADIAANIAQSRLNVALSSIKSAAQADKQLANLLQNTIENVPVSSIRGSNINRSA